MCWGTTSVLKFLFACNSSIHFYCRCESLAELLWRNRQQIIKVDLLRQQLPIEIPQGTADIQPELNKTVTGLLSTLVTR